MIKTSFGFFILALVVLATPSAADDLTGSERFLCSATQATGCLDGGECYAVSLIEINMPQFIEVDLENKLLSTTKASGLNRVTPIKNYERADGLIYLQGVQLERAVSMVIAEATGQASIAMATDGIGALIFGACTTLPEGEQE